jgi:hypothetical protein
MRRQFFRRESKNSDCMEARKIAESGRRLKEESGLRRAVIGDQQIGEELRA